MEKDLYNSQDILARIADVLYTRLPQNGGDPQASYVAKLYSKGEDAALKKVGEEAAEVVIAAKNHDPQALVYEVADLWFHTMIVLNQQGLRPEQVIQELARREGLSGLVEFAARSPQ